MKTEERRTLPRVAAVYQITFECFRHGIKTGEGVARTVNVSENGALLETPFAIDLDASLILSINAPFYMLVMRGDVVHSRLVPDGTYHVGVKLTDVIEGTWEHLRLDIRHRLNEYFDEN